MQPRTALTAVAKASSRTDSCSLWKALGWKEEFFLIFLEFFLNDLGLVFSSYQISPYWSLSDNRCIVSCCLFEKNLDKSIIRKKYELRIVIWI